MINETQKKQMLEYLAEKLSSSYSKIDPRTKKNVDQYDSNYILLDDNTVLFMIDRNYDINALHEWGAKAKNMKGINDISFIVYKDGKNFFRSNAQEYRICVPDKYQKYDNTEINKMILFTPEEGFINFNYNILQYYQPESPRLAEGVKKYKFEKVPHNKINGYQQLPWFSSQDYIWKEDPEFLDNEIKIFNSEILSL